MKTLITAVKMFIALSLITGVIYPALITVVGEWGFSKKAHGQKIASQQGSLIGSALIAQKFESPRYFASRPSASDYNALSSGGTNLAPTSAALLAQVQSRQSSGATRDLLFSSASGLDPHISPDAAFNQAGRVALARGMSEEEVRSMIMKLREPRQFRVLGEERVNVLLLNLALDERLKP